MASVTGAWALQGEVQLPNAAWATILRFTGEAPAAATARVVAEAAAAALAELASESAGVTEYMRGLSTRPRLAEAFAAELLFGQGAWILALGSLSAFYSNHPPNHPPNPALPTTLPTPPSQPPSPTRQTPPWHATSPRGGKCWPRTSALQRARRSST